MKKIVVIVDRNVETGRIANAIAHCSAGISISKFDEYETSNGITCTLSNHPIIILSAKNKNQVKNALIKADEAKLEYSFFASTMWRETPEEQVAETKSTSFDDLEVIACAIYGESEEVDKIARKFSLYR